MKITNQEAALAPITLAKQTMDQEAAPGPQTIAIPITKIDTKIKTTRTITIARTILAQTMMPT